MYIRQHGLDDLDASSYLDGAVEAFQIYNC